MTIQKAREILGEKAKKYTDQQLQDMINFLVKLCNVTIDSVIGEK